MNALIEKFWPYIVMSLLAIAAAFCLHLYIEEKADFSAFRATVEQRDRDAEAALKTAVEQGEKNLNEVKESYEKRIPVIERNAVRAYCLRNPELCKVAQPTSCPTGIPLDDGAEPERVACTREFIGICTTDAAKVGAWQDYCKRNNCPIED